MRKIRIYLHGPCVCSQFFTTEFFPCHAFLLPCAPFR